MTQVPEGFAPLEPISPFNELVGPLYIKSTGERSVIIATRVGDHHINMQGVMYGGMMATLADIAIGYNLAIQKTPREPMLTVNLSIDFAGVALLGDWIEARADVQKRGRNMGFVSVFIWCGDKRIARASGVMHANPKRQKS